MATKKKQKQRNALSASDILSGGELAREWVELPGRDGGVWVWELSGEEQEAWQQSSIKMTRDNRGRPHAEPLQDHRTWARLVAWTVRDEEGNRLFSNEQIPDLAKQPARTLAKLSKVARRLNGIADEEDAVDVAAGNSERGPTDTSS